MNTAQFFDSIFNNSAQNAIIIMNTEGIIQQVNPAFTTSYGYNTEDLQSKHLRVLYTEKDQITLKPDIEINTTRRQGFSGDENYLIHKDNTPIWVSGESISVKSDNDTLIVKIIHNIHAQKQLERYLLSSSELLDSLFNSVNTGLLLLDSRLRIVRTNPAFDKMFSLNERMSEGSKLQDIPHSFWRDEEVRNDIRNALVNGKRIAKECISGNNSNDFRKISITSKFILGETTSERTLLLVLKFI